MGHHADHEAGQDSESSQIGRTSRLQLPVHVDDLLAIDVEQLGGRASFDAVTMWNVLEHTFDPGAVLARCWELLRDDGIVAFIIPSWESIDRHLFGRYWIGFDTPRHLFVFPNETLVEILHNQGFQVVDNRCLFGGYYAFIQSIFGLSRSHMSPSAAKALEQFLLFPGLRFPFEPFFMVAGAAYVASWRVKSIENKSSSYLDLPERGCPNSE